MKILAGQFKGKNFFMPKGIRPTQNVVRKSVFDMLGQDLGGVSFLELFAGSGAMGLEAISRGAARVLFVEKGPRTSEILRENLDYFMSKVSGRYEVMETDALASIKSLASRGERFDVVFADPPYYREQAKKTLKTLGAYDILTPDSLVVIQHEKREILPSSEGRFSLIRQRKFGSNVLSMYKVAEAQDRN